MKKSILIALLISSFVHLSANAKQPLSVQAIDDKKVLSNLSSTGETKTDNYVFKKQGATKPISANDAWEGVTYILENKSFTRFDEAPYNFHFE